MLLETFISKSELIKLMRRESNAELAAPVAPGREDCISIDEDIARDNPCPHCQQAMTLLPFRSREDNCLYIAAVVYCELCEYALEF